MRRRLLAALLLSAGPAFAASAKSVDLSAQFPGAAVHGRGAANTCHVFSTMALLEAAVKRRWGVSAALSEADLFVRKLASDSDYYRRARKALDGARGAEPVCRFLAWGDAKEDIEFAVDNGVAKAEDAPWPAFARRYDGFAKEPLPRRTQVGYSASVESAGSALAKERAASRSLLQGFRVFRKNYESKELPSEACRAAGADRRRALVESFDRGVPAGVNINVAGLPEWGPDQGFAGRAFTATGYTTDEQGRVLLQSRDSRGAVNPPVPEERFCRISRILQVLGPAE